MVKGARYVGYYVTNYNTILPSDGDLGDIANTLWYQFIKTQFNDYTWSNYYQRELFDNPKFNHDDPDDTLADIKRTLLIHLKSKARIYDRMFNAYMADFNPLWNVDGVVGEIRETNHTGTDTDAHTGSDSTSTTDGGTIIRTGNETDRKEGKEATTTSGNKETEFHGASVNVTSKTTFDDESWNLAEKVEQGFTEDAGHERKDKETYNNVKDETDFTNRVDTHSYNSVTDTRDLTGSATNTYDSTLQRTKALKDTDLFMQIRQGNIGITRSDELIGHSLELFGSELYDFVHYVVNDCINQLAYSLY